MYIDVVQMDIGRKKELVMQDVKEVPVKKHVILERKDVVEVNLKCVIQQELHGQDNRVRMDVKL